VTETVLELIDPGLGASLQDLGRRGWKRYGVPPGGALDDHAARWANLLLGNPLNAPVLEFLFHGATLRALRDVELALTGAALGPGPGPVRWHTRLLTRGEEMTLPPSASGVWTYVATRGGFVGARWFGSVTAFPRGGLGNTLAEGAILARPEQIGPALPSAVGRRWIDATEQRDYAHPPQIRLWRGPQWDLFTETSRAAFFEKPWCVSASSDRTGYRLDGSLLNPPTTSLPSEPVIPGSIQVPPDGAPIVTMRDGPTVGGYPKLGLVDPGHLSWLAQCRPGQEIRFTLIDLAERAEPVAKR
jgi:biotin-dependent carboxylase-like uncharacterized protein